MFSKKQAESFPGRTFYKGKGVDLGRFIPWLLAAFVVAAILAEGMAQLFRLGHYYIFIVPLAAAACVGGMVHLAVNRGHCRSPFVAGLAGFCAGLLLYIGYFYFGMLHDVGPEAVQHPEFFPKYMRLRMMIERTRDIHDTGRDDEEKAPRADNVYMNWGRFGLELIFVVAVTAGMGIRRARKAYCENCRRWMVREMTEFDPGSSEELTEAFRTNSARSLAALCAKAPYSTIPNITLAADFCPNLKEGVSRDCPVYVSLKEISMAPKSAVLDTFEQSKGRLLAGGLQLNADEIPALAPRFKVFETVAGRSAVSALLPKEEPDESVASKDATYADITPLSQDHAGKIMTRKTVLIGNAFAFVILLSFFGSMGLVLWGLTTGFPDHPPAEGVSPAAKTFGIVLIAVGLTWFVVFLVIAFTDMSAFGNRYVRKVLREEFARRSSLMVDSNDPDAIFVEIVPKMNWGKMMMENASDVGLLVVDRKKREIRFEGDKERWRIPAVAITQCQFEQFVQQQGHARTKTFYAVVRANHRSGFWEAPIRERGKQGLFSRGRKKSTLKLVEAIEGIRPASQSTLTHA
jgi:hypothetical protein